MPFESDKQRKYLWANKPEVAKKIAYHAGGGYSGNPAIEAKLKEIYDRKMQTTGGKYKGIISGEMNQIRKMMYDQAARDKTARRQGGGGQPMQIGAIQGEVQDHWKHPTPMDAPQTTKMYWDPEQFTFVEGPGEGVREITQTRGDLSGINPMNSTQVKQFNQGGEVDMFNNKGLKKLTQKDRYGNTVTYEYEAPEKPIDQTALIKHMMDLQNEVPEVDVEIGMEGFGFASGGSTDHPGEPKGTDTVPAWLTPGEFVMNAEATEMYGPIIEQMNNHGREIQRAQGGPIPRYEADGGWIDDYMLDRLRQQESGGGKYLKSPAGALGPYQIMPGTAANPGYGLPPVKDPYDEEESRQFARNYLMALQERNPDASPNEILQMYNAGEKRIRNSMKGKGKPLARETVEYPARVLGQLGGGDEELDEANLYEGWDGDVPPVVSEAEVPNPDLPNIPGISRAYGAEEEEPKGEGKKRGRMKGRQNVDAGEDEEFVPVLERPIEEEAEKITNRERAQEQRLLDKGEGWKPEHAGGHGNREDAQAIRENIGKVNVPQVEPAAFDDAEDEWISEEIIEDPEYTAKSEAEQQEEIDAIVSDPAENTDGPGNNQQGPQVKNKEVEEVGKQAANDDPEAVDRIKKAFTGAFGKLFDDEQLATAAIMYLGSRALGYSHAGSLRWSAKNYLTGVQNKASAATAAKAEIKKNAVEFTKKDKWTPKSIAEYEKTGDLSVLKSKEGAGLLPQAGTGEFKEFFKDGKQVRAQKYKVGEGQYVWLGPKGEMINQTYTDDAAFHKGTPEYRERRTRATGAASKRFEEIFKREDRFRIGSGDNTSWEQHTRIGPEQAADEFWNWAEKNGLDPESDEAMQVMTRAYEEAINEGQANPKAKPKRLRKFLDRARIRYATSAPELFQTSTDKQGDPIYVRQEVMDKLENNMFIAAAELPGTKGLKPHQQKEKIYNLAIAEWSKLDPSKQETYNEQAKKSGRTGFILYTENRLGEIMAKAK